MAKRITYKVAVKFGKKWETQGGYWSMKFINTYRKKLGHNRIKIIGAKR